MRPAAPANYPAANSASFASGPILTSMECPSCGIYNLPTAERCDCGHDLRSWTGSGSSESSDFFTPRTRILLGCLSIAGGIFAAIMAGEHSGSQERVVAPLLTGLGAYQIVLGRRGRSVATEVKLRLHPGESVLLLRPFSTDETLSAQRVQGSMSWFGFIPRTPLERLAVQLKKLGTFICIGEPGKVPPDSGPKTLYLPATNWEPMVKEMIEKCRFVVFRSGFSWYSAQEMQWASGVGPRRVLFWFPRENEVDYIEFRRLAPAYLPCRNIPDASRVRFVYFDDLWNAIPITVGVMDVVFGVGWSVWKSLGSFLERIGVELEFRNFQIRWVIALRLLIYLAGALLFLLWILSRQ